MLLAEVIPPLGAGLRAEITSETMISETVPETVLADHPTLSSVPAIVISDPLSNTVSTWSILVVQSCFDSFNWSIGTVAFRLPSLAINITTPISLLQGEDLSIAATSTMPRDIIFAISANGKLTQGELILSSAAGALSKDEAALLSVINSSCQILSWDVDTTAFTLPTLAINNTTDNPLLAGDTAISSSADVTRSQDQILQVSISKALTLSGIINNTTDNPLLASGIALSSSVTMEMNQGQIFQSSAVDTLSESDMLSMDINKKISRIEEIILINTTRVSPTQKWNLLTKPIKFTGEAELLFSLQLPSNFSHMSPIGIVSKAGTPEALAKAQALLNKYNSRNVIKFAKPTPTPKPTN